MTPMMFTQEAGLPLFEPLLARLQAEAGHFETRRFPDGETYLRVTSEVAGRHCVVLANLAQPNDKFLSLAFLLSTLRDMGAATVGLIAPYLSYMRQDIRFQPGEALTSRIFAELISAQTDWLVTVDPHLHRYHSLDEIYKVPAIAVKGAPVLAQWLASQHEDLLLVGPDAESEQWVGAIAHQIDQPFIVGRKERHGDRDVVISLPDVQRFRGRTAVIIDDVISSGQTLLKTLDALKKADFDKIDCAAIHGIFADDADLKLMQSGLRRLVTTNSIPHTSNAVDLSAAIAHAAMQQLATGAEL